MSEKGLTLNQINYLNIGLMIGSAFLAFLYPFELFLFVYAFLGPLHYLTEISWLHDRQYFTQGKYDYLFLTAASLIITLVGLGIIRSLTPLTIPAITLTVFVSALVFITFKNIIFRILLISLILLVSINLIEINFVNTTFGLFLPTIIHVCLFTGLFVLIGSLKSKNLSGFASLAVFVLCILSFFVFYPVHPELFATEFVKKTYQDFSILNFALSVPFSQHSLDIPNNLNEYNNYVNNTLYSQPQAFAIMSFIAFSYTYHYLNWFSKTSIIQWHEISKTRLSIIVFIWLVSIGVFLYDYGIGLTWLTFLSLSHVFLEFPLNHLTFINIGKALSGLRQKNIKN